MSRRCPKRYHQFLNWLRKSRGQFILTPHIIRISRRGIDLALQGAHPALRFRLESTVSRGPWVSIDVVKGKEREGVIRFYGAEVPAQDGLWKSLALPVEDPRCWNSREELWEELCLEAFLLCCNKDFSDGALSEYAQRVLDEM